MTDKRKILNIGEATVEPVEGTRMRITLGDKTTEVEYRDLWAALFLLGDDERRDAMMPVQKKDMMVFSRKHQIRLTKDVKAGETVNVWCEVNVPQTVVNAIVEKEGAKILYQAPPELYTPPALDAPKQEVQ